MAGNQTPFTIVLNIKDAESAMAALRAFGAQGEGALKRIEAASKDNRKEINEASRTWLAYERTLEGSAAAMQRTALMIKQADQSLAAGRITVQQHAAALKDFGGAADTAAGRTGMLRGALGGLALQGQDVAVQMAAGTNGLIIFAQQFPQIASLFGGAGAVIGLLGAGAAAAALTIGALGGGMKAQKEAAEATKATNAALNNTFADQAKNAYELAQQYKTLSAEMQAVERLSLLAARRRIQDEIKSQRGSISAELEKITAERTRFEALAYESETGMVSDPAQFFRLEALSKAYDVVERFKNGGTVQDLATELSRLIQAGGPAAAELEKVAGGLIEAARRSIELGTEAKFVEEALKLIYGAADGAAGALGRFRDAQADAAKDLSTWTAELSAEVEALKKGEAAVKEFEKAKASDAAKTKAYELAIKAGKTETEALKIATDAAALTVEKLTLKEQAAADKRAGRKGETAAEREAKAYARVVDQLDREIAGQTARSEAVGKGAAAVEEANVQAKIAAELSKAQAEAGTEEARVIGEKVRQLEKLKRAEREAQQIRDAEKELAFAKSELGLMGQAEPVRERALESLKIQAEAQEMAKTATAGTVAEWVRLQEQIADTRGLKAFAQEVQGTAKDLSRDVTEALWDGMTGRGGLDRWQDFGEAIGKRIALGVLENQIVLPITIMAVNAMPSLFGITSPAGAGIPAAAGGGGVTDVLSMGTKFMPSSWTSGLTSSIDAWGMSTLGIGTAAAPGMTAATGGLAHSIGVSPAIGGVTNAAVAPGAATAGTGLSSLLGAGAAGFGIGMLAGQLGLKPAPAAGVGGLGGAGIGFMVGGPVGAVIGGIAGVIGGLIGGKRKPSNFGAGGVYDTETEKYNRWEDKPNEETLAMRDGVERNIAAISKAFSALEGAKLPAKIQYAVGSRDDWEVGIQGRGKYYSDVGDGDAFNVNVAKMFAESITGVAPEIETALSKIDWGAGIEEGIRLLDLADRISRSSTALDDLDRSLGGVEKAAKKAAAESMQGAKDELADAEKIGLGGQYRRILEALIRGTFDPAVAEYTDLQATMAAARGQTAALKETIKDLGLAITEAEVDAAALAQLNAVRAVNSGSRDATLNALRGEEWRNSLSNYAEAYKTELININQLWGHSAEAAAEIATANEIVRLQFLSLAAQGEISADALRKLKDELPLFADAIDGAASALDMALQTAREIAIGSDFAGVRSALQPGYQPTATDILANAGVDPTGPALRWVAEALDSFSGDWQRNIAVLAGLDGQHGLRQELAKQTVYDPITETDKRVYTDEQISTILSAAVQIASGAQQTATQNQDAIRQGKTQIDALIRGGQPANAMELLSGIGVDSAVLPETTARIQRLFDALGAGSADVHLLQEAYDGIQANLVAGKLEAGDFAAVLGHITQRFDAASHAADAAVQAQQQAAAQDLDQAWTRAVQSLIQATEQLAGGFGAARQSLADFGRSLRVDSALSPYGPERRRALAVQEVWRLAGETRSADPAEALMAIQALQPAITAALAASKDVNTLLGPGYALDFEAMTGLLASTETTAERQERVQRDQLGELRRLSGVSETGFSSLETALRETLKKGDFSDYGTGSQGILNRVLAAAVPEYDGGWEPGAFEAWALSRVPGDANLGKNVELNAMLATLGANPYGFNGVGTWANPLKALKGSDPDNERVAAANYLLRLNGHPGFAAGGYHLGGWRVVGERGPELEATGPARYWSNDQTMEMLAGARRPASSPPAAAPQQSDDSGAMARELRELRREVRALHGTARDHLSVAVEAGDKGLAELSGMNRALTGLRKRERAA